MICAGKASLRLNSGFEVSDASVQSALTKVKLLTGLHGRWETLSKHPLTICDTGHNPEGINEVLQNIAAVAYEKLHFVLGVVNDKDISKNAGTCACSAKTRYILF